MRTTIYTITVKDAESIGTNVYANKVAFDRAYDAVARAAWKGFFGDVEYQDDPRTAFDMLYKNSGHIDALDTEEEIEIEPPAGAAIMFLVQFWKGPDLMDAQEITFSPDHRPDLSKPAALRAELVKVANDFREGEGSDHDLVTIDGPFQISAGRPATFTVWGNGGELTVDAMTGDVVGYDPTAGDTIAEGETAAYADISRFDVREFQRAYPAEQIAGQRVDICDIGFWADGKAYEAAVPEVRKEIAERRT